MSYSAYVNGVVTQALASPSINKAMEDGIASSNVRPVIAVLTLENVAPHGGANAIGGVKVNCTLVQDAQARRRVGEISSALKSLVDMCSECPAPIVVRFEITFSNGKREFGVLTHSV